MRDAPGAKQFVMPGLVRNRPAMTKTAAAHDEARGTIQLNDC